MIFKKLEQLAICRQLLGGEPQETHSGLAEWHKQASEMRQAHRYWVELGDQLWIQNK